MARRGEDRVDAIAFGDPAGVEHEHAIAGLRDHAHVVGDQDERHAAGAHQLSGGMKQRIVIAMALAADPDLIIADEPTTALDVTVQAEILNLIRALKEKTGMAVILITHDLTVVRQFADHVYVMQHGEVR